MLELRAVCLWYLVVAKTMIKKHMIDGQLNQKQHNNNIVNNPSGKSGKFYTSSFLASSTHEGFVLQKSKMLFLKSILRNIC